MRTPDQTNAAPDVAWVNYGSGHASARACDDREHVGGPVLMQRGGKVRFIAGKPAGWRCPVCVARRAALKELAVAA